MLRVGLGLGIAWHGYATLFGGSADAPHMAGMIDALTANTPNMPFPEFFAYLATGGGLFGGVLIALGLLTRPALLLVSAVLAFAAFFFLQGSPFAERELTLIYLLGALVLLAIGPGRYSLDYWLLRPRSRW